MSQFGFDALIATRFMLRKYREVLLSVSLILEFGSKPLICQCCTNLTVLRILAVQCMRHPRGRCYHLPPAALARLRNMYEPSLIEFEATATK
jgi:hypothetical protein